MDWQDHLQYCVQTACTMEVMAVKPGNVSPIASFADASVTDFIVSATAVAPVIAECQSKGVGQTIWHAVMATQQAVGTNTNLGIILLLAPLAAVPQHNSLLEGIQTALDSLTVNDSRFTFEAIRIANPGGLGSASAQDVRQPADMPLRDCMSLAADWDSIAKQYSNGFREVLMDGQEMLQEAGRNIALQSQQITWVALKLLSQHPDTLIARKCGTETAAKATNLANDVVMSGWPDGFSSDARFRRLDTFLRADGNRRNPGTTADLIAGILFAALREKRLTPEGDWWHFPDRSL